MARDLRPKTKLKRRFGLLQKDESKRKAVFKKKTDYGLRIEEKQKLKFIYEILERQLRRYFREAKREGENTGDIVLTLLETRLDNVVYRLGLAVTRSQTRQLVTHGHMKIDGKKVNIPSYSVSPGQEIEMKMTTYKKLFPESDKNIKTELPAWLERKDNVGKVIRRPEKDELRRDVAMSHVVELYSRM